MLVSTICSGCAADAHTTMPLTWPCTQNGYHPSAIKRPNQDPCQSTLPPPQWGTRASTRVSDIAPLRWRQSHWAGAHPRTPVYSAKRTHTPQSAHSHSAPPSTSPTHPSIHLLSSRSFLSTTLYFKHPHLRLLSLIVPPYLLERVPHSRSSANSAEGGKQTQKCKTRSKVVVDSRRRRKEQACRLK